MAKVDLYAILGVSKDATLADIKRAYRAIARENHPDRTGGDAAREARFKEATFAYEVLSDPDERAEYDAYPSDGAGGGGGAAGFGGGSWDDALRAFEEKVAASERRKQSHAEAVRQQRANDRDMFQQLFGGARAGATADTAPPLVGGRATAGAGEELEVEIRVDFMTAALGGRKQVAFEVMVPGRGPMRDSVDVHIPHAVEDGTRLRLRGRGGYRGGSRGDLYVKVRVASHPLYRREQNDILLQLPLTPAEAIGGVRLEVPTIWGQCTLKVPPGVNSGSKLRLRGRGLGPADQPGARGNQVIEIKVVVPKSVPREALEALRRCEAAWAFSPREGRW